MSWLNDLRHDGRQKVAPSLSCKCISYKIGRSFTTTYFELLRNKSRVGDQATYGQAINYPSIKEKHAEHIIPEYVVIGKYKVLFLIKVGGG
jgi:hypothetical protein